MGEGGGDERDYEECEANKRDRVIGGGEALEDVEDEDRARDVVSGEEGIKVNLRYMIPVADVPTAARPCLLSANRGCVA